jgi:hypothetical protein
MKINISQIMLTSQCTLNTCSISTKRSKYVLLLHVLEYTRYLDLFVLLLHVLEYTGYLDIFVLILHVAVQKGLNI